MKTVAFSLTMPNIGSWNGQWSGEGNLYVKFRRVPDDVASQIDDKSFYYNFGDGWGANVRASIVDSRERQRLQRKSHGFCGYDWMIDSIVKHEEIKIDTVNVFVRV